MTCSRADSKLAEEFEQLLRSGDRANDLQDKLMDALKWTEGKLVNPSLIKELEMTAKTCLRQFLEAQPRYTMLSGITPNPAIANELVIEHDGRGRINIQIPNEVRLWLLQTQSMISS